MSKQQPGIECYQHCIYVKPDSDKSRRKIARPVSWLWQGKVVSATLPVSFIKGGMGHE